MKWYTTKTKPSYDKYITVVHNIYIAGKTELCTTTGILKVMSDKGWTVLNRNTGTGCYIPLTDIHGWCLESSFADDAFYAIYREPVEVTCPMCGNKTTVTSHAYNICYAEVPVAIDTLRDCLVLDWNNIDMSSDFEYICDHCEGKVAPDLLTLQRMVKEQRKPAKSFIDEPDKMLDYLLLSKEEFLKSYSYLTEKDWELTRKDVINSFKKGK